MAKEVALHQMWHVIMVMTNQKSPAYLFHQNAVFIHFYRQSVLRLNSLLYTLTTELYNGKECLAAPARLDSTR